jgi:hypothetical protein
MEPVPESRHEGFMIDAVCTTIQGPCNINLNATSEGAGGYGTIVNCRTELRRMRKL